MDKQLRKLVAHEGSCLQLSPSGTKIICTLTGHELPLQFNAVHQYIKARKYTRLKAAAEAKDALRKYEPFIQQSRNFQDKLYCALTCQLLGKSLDAVRQHMRGKKFQRAKERYQNDELELMDEPSLREDATEAEPMDSQEAPSGSAAAAAVAAAKPSAAEPSGNEADGLWVPDEYVEMEAQATAEAANGMAHADDGAGAAADHPGEASPAGAAAVAVSAAGPSENGAVHESSSGRRPKRPKPKHKAKKQRLA